MSHHAPRSFVLAALLALPFAPAAAAQRAFSVEGGVVTAFEDAAVIMGIRASHARVGAAGVDFSLATFPDGLVEGFVLLLPNLDLATAAPVGERAWLLPRFGVSALVGVGEGGGGAIPGFNVGIGLLGHVAERAGVRLDVTYIRLISDGDSAGFTAITFGFAWMR